MADARSHRRLSTALVVVAYSHHGEAGARVRCEAYDLGAGGLAMLDTSELAPGAALVLELELRGRTRPPLRLTGEVRWCRHDPLLDAYRTGIEFTDRTPAHERELLAYVDEVYRMRDLGPT